MNYNSRPSKREIDKRLKEAKQALQNQRVAFASEPKIVGELMALEIGDTDEVWALILDLLEELELDDYSGKYPPEKSYEPTIADCELWAFSWYSALLKKTMYLKGCGESIALNGNWTGTGSGTGTHDRMMDVILAIYNTLFGPP